MKTLAFLMLVVSLAMGAPAPGYHLLTKFEVGGDGGWDYLTMDSAAHRLFISRGTRVMVVDVESGKLAGEIADTPGVHGIALAPDLGRGFTSNGGDSTVTIFDLKDLKSLGRVKVGENPDAILYDPATKRVFTFNGRSHDATVIDAAGGTVLGSIDVGGKPEFAVSDEKGRIYVNNEDKSEVLAIDAAKMTVVAHWPLDPCKSPSGLAIDKKNHRLFSVCSNKTMAVLDSESGRLVTTLPIGSGVDAAGFDPGTGLAFSSNGEGTLTVVQEETPDKFSVAENAATEPRARTMALDTKTHKVYLVTAKFEAAAAPTAEQPRPRPRPVPGSFVVLVMGK